MTSRLWRETNDVCWYPGISHYPLSFPLYKLGERLLFFKEEFYCINTHHGISAKECAHDTPIFSQLPHIWAHAAEVCPANGSHLGEVTDRFQGEQGSNGIQVSKNRWVKELSRASRRMWCCQWHIPWKVCGLCEVQEGWDDVANVGRSAPLQLQNPPGEIWHSTPASLLTAKV